MKQKRSIIIALGVVSVAVGLTLYNKKAEGRSPAETNAQPSQTRGPQRQDEGQESHSRQEREMRKDSARLEREKMIAHWTANASAGLALSKRYLIADLGPTTEEAAELEKIFARREAELAALLKISAEDTGDDTETMRRICAQLRNQGLRDDLAGILSPEKLATFDANEATRVRETNEARAYRDMAEINGVVPLSDTQKQLVLAALISNAPAKVGHEADARALMTLHYGLALADIDPSGIRGLSNMVSASLNYEIPTSDTGSAQYEQWTRENKSRRIESELAALRDILDETQLARYRAHLETELPW